MLFISRFKLRLGNRGQQNRVKHAQDVACLRECCSGSYCGGIGISRGLETGSFVHQVLNPRVRLVNLIGEIPISRTRALGSRVRGLTQESSFFARNFQLDQGVPGGLGGPVDRSRSACSTSCSIRTGDGTPTHISTPDDLASSSNGSSRYRCRRLVALDTAGPDHTDSPRGGCDSSPQISNCERDLNSTVPKWNNLDV